LIKLEENSIDPTKEYEFSLYKRQEIKLKYVEKMFVGPFHMIAVSSDYSINI